MTPIFDSNCDVIAWFDGKNFFDEDIEWVAFLQSGNCFSVENLDWLGALHEGSLLDTNGKPVGWLQGKSPSGTLPLLKPLRPLRPLRPLGEWSNLSFNQWLNP